MRAPMCLPNFVTASGVVAGMAIAVVLCEARPFGRCEQGIWTTDLGSDPTTAAAAAAEAPNRAAELIFPSAFSASVITGGPHALGHGCGLAARKLFPENWLFVIQSALTNWWSAPLCSSERQR